MKQCDNRQHFVDCYWIDTVSHRLRNLVLLIVALSFVYNTHLASTVKLTEDIRHHQLRSYSTITWGATVPSLEQLQYHHLSSYSTITWGATVPSLEELQYHHLRSYSTITWKATVPSLEELQYHHLRSYSTITWGATVPSLEELQYHQLRSYSTVTWGSKILKFVTKNEINNIHFGPKITHFLFSLKLRCFIFKFHCIKSR
jgi:hypothetical protein